MTEDGLTAADLHAQVGTLLDEGLCPACFGRHFARLGKGLQNSERGHALAHWHGDGEPGEDDVPGMEDLVSAWTDAGSPEKLTTPYADCTLCGGVMGELSVMAEAVADKLSDVEHQHFLMGTRFDPCVLARQDELWERTGPDLTEHIKLEVNREVGKLVGERTGKDVEFGRPDVTVLLDTRLHSVSLRISPFYVYGRYRKLERGIPQTRWPCWVCGGIGCRRCGFRGRLYDDSVQDLIGAVLIEAARATDCTFHGMGREDIDALMLGDGRPFVLELVAPQTRTLDLTALEMAVNGACLGRVEVEGFRSARASEVQGVKEAKPDKSYRAKVHFSTEVSDENLKMVEMAFAGAPIEQRTPDRVSHRRADLVRERTVRSLSAKATGPREAILEVTAEAGTYIKELISGDGGRTRPSVSGLLGIPCLVVELDVTAVHAKDRMW
jgi:tRNA pseudouridine synthase 10